MVRLPRAIQSRGKRFATQYTEVQSIQQRATDLAMLCIYEAGVRDPIELAHTTGISIEAAKYVMGGAAENVNLDSCASIMAALGYRLKFQREPMFPKKAKSNVLPFQTKK